MSSTRTERRWRAEGRPAGGTWPHTCVVCGEEFEAKREDATTCSGRCRVRAHRKPVTDTGRKVKRKPPPKVAGRKKKPARKKGRGRRTRQTPWSETGLLYDPKWATQSECLEHLRRALEIEASPYSDGYTYTPWKLGAPRAMNNESVFVLNPFGVPVKELQLDRARLENHGWAMGKKPGSRKGLLFFVPDFLERERQQAAQRLRDERVATEKAKQEKRKRQQHGRHYRAQKKLKRLQLDVPFTEAALKKESRRHLLECHPDKGGSKEAFQELSEEVRLVRRALGLEAPTTPGEAFEDVFGESIFEDLFGKP